MYEKLEKITELKEKGILSESEFEIEKKKILNSLVNQTSAEPSSQQKPKTIQNKNANGAGIAGFIIAVLGGFNWYLTLPFGLIGLVFSIVGVNKPKDKYKRGLAIAGLIISILVLLFGIGFYVAMITNKDVTKLAPKYY